MCPAKNRRTPQGVGGHSVMSDPKPELRVFVVGELSGDPADWSELTGRTFVIAASEEEALALAPDCPQFVRPVSLARPAVLAVVPACPTNLGA